MKDLLRNLLLKEDLFNEIVSEDFPNMVQERSIQEEEAEELPTGMARKHLYHGTHYSHFSWQSKDFQMHMGKTQVIIRRSSIRLTGDCSSETLQVRQEWNATVHDLKETAHPEYCNLHNSYSQR